MNNTFFDPVLGAYRVRPETIFTVDPGGFGSKVNGMHENGHPLGCVNTFGATHPPTNEQEGSVWMSIPKRLVLPMIAHFDNLLLVETNDLESRIKFYDDEISKLRTIIEEESAAKRVAFEKAEELDEVEKRRISRIPEEDVLNAANGRRYGFHPVPIVGTL